MEIKGHFVKKIYYRNDNGYIVALFLCEQKYGEEEVVVTGYIGEIDKDTQYWLIGDYVEHPKYGIQFKVESFKKIIAADEDGLIRYFSSSIFPGIGKKYAAVIVNTLGINALEKIKADNDVLKLVPKMNKKRREAILEGVKQEVEEDVLYLTSHHLSLKNVMKLKNVYKDNLMSVLLDNPYQVIREVGGIGFHTIDQFSLSIGIDLDNLQRLMAYSDEILMAKCMRNGDSYISIEEYEKAILKELHEYIVNTDDIIEGLIMDRRIIVDGDKVYPVSQYDAENYISRFLSAFPCEKLREIDEDTLSSYLTEFENEIGIQYQDKQLEAIKTIFKKDILILTGGPGTGKTTIVRAMMELCNKIYTANSIQLIAPTGRAAKRLTELTGYEAKTIHSLLLWDKETGKFAKDEKDPLTQEILIIDEFSMVDTFLFYNLLKASPYLKKLVIIGDSDQLPSVAMGAVLRDIIESDCFDVIKLDKIYRQKEGSDIISLAYAIKNNECDEIPVENDIRFIECPHNEIKKTILFVVQSALENFDTLEDGFMNVQVLSPKHMGLNGINSLNVALQNKFNPYSVNKRELQVGYRTFRMNDKVIQLKNQPDDDVYNGDIGIVIEIIFAVEDVNNQNRIVVDFDGRIVEYTAETFNNITHAYCMSVHKSQGSEYPIIIMPFDKEYGIMLQKRLIYTAVTRAYRNLIFVGDKQAFFKGINTIDHFNRRTSLREKIERCMEYNNE